MIPIGKRVKFIKKGFDYQNNVRTIEDVYSWGFIMRGLTTIEEELVDGLLSRSIVEKYNISETEVEGSSNKVLNEYFIPFRDILRVEDPMPYLSELLTSSDKRLRALGIYLQNQSKYDDLIGEPT